MADTSDTEESEPNFTDPGICGSCAHWSLRASSGAECAEDWGICRNDKITAILKPTGANGVRYALRTLNASQEVTDEAVQALGVYFESRFGCRLWEGMQ